MKWVRNNFLNFAGQKLQSIILDLLFSTNLL